LDGACLEDAVGAVPTAHGKGDDDGLERSETVQEVEWVRQNNLAYGALIVAGVYMVQPSLTASALDVTARICVIAFSYDSDYPMGVGSTMSLSESAGRDSSVEPACDRREGAMVGRHDRKLARRSARSSIPPSGRSPPTPPRSTRVARRGASCRP
jgi:hypothetical protein